MPKRNRLLGLNCLKWQNYKQRFHELFEQHKLEIQREPHKFALGCSVGIIVNFFPTMGLGFALAFLTASLLRANRVSAPAISLITGPLIPFKYALNLLVGGIIQASETEDLFEFIARQYTLIFKIGSFRDQIFSFLDFFGSTFILGAVINAAIFGTGCYYLVRYLIIKRTGHKIRLLKPGIFLPGYKSDR